MQEARITRDVELDLDVVAARELAQLREGALMIEWAAPQLPAEETRSLALMQRELLLWHRIWPSDPARPLLALRAHAMADQLLSAAGFNRAA